MIELVLLLGLLTQTPQDFPPGTLERSALPTNRALSYQFDDVRIATILGWLQRVGVEPPVPIAGRVSGWLWAQAPSSGWWRVADYRVEGELTSPLLDVDRFSIRTARVRFGYRDDLWTFGSVSGQIESRTSDTERIVLGQASLNAQLPMSATATARASGSIEDVSLSNVLATFGIRDIVPTGVAVGNFQLSTPLNALSQPLAWQASGNVDVSDLSVGQIAGLQLASQWQLQNRVLTLARANVILDQQVVTVAGNLGLDTPFDWSVVVPSQPVQLSTNLFRSLTVDQKTSVYLPMGKVDLSASANGSLAPWQAAYGLQVSNGQVNWLGNDIANLDTRVRLVSGGLLLDSLSANIASGRVDAQAAFSSQPDDPVSLNLSYRQIDLSRISLPVAGLSSAPTNHQNASDEELKTGAFSHAGARYDLQGVVTGSARLTAPQDRLDDLQAMAVELVGVGEGVRINEWGLGNVEYQLNKASGISDLKLDLKDAGVSRRWQATGDLQPVDERWVYHIDAQGNQLDLSVPQLIKLMGMEPNLPVALEILLVTGNIKFEGDSVAGLTATQFNLSNVTTLEQNRVVWAQGRLQGYTDPQLIQINEAHFTVGGSTWDASATWHRQAKPAADNQDDRLNLTIEDLSLETLQAWSLLPLPRGITEGKRPRGIIDATINVRRPVLANQRAIANWSGDVAASITDLKLGRQALGDLALDGQLSPERWQGQMNGILLDAPVDGQVTLLLAAQPAWSVEEVRGQVAWIGAQIGRLTSLWQSDEKSFQWRGLANIRSQFVWRANGTHAGTAEVEIPQLAYQGRSIVRELRAELIMDEQQVRLARLDGGLGGGRMDLRGGYNLQTHRVEGLAVDLNRIDLNQAAQLLDPDMAVDIRGRADLRAKVWLNRGFDLHGDLRVHDVVWSGIPVSQAHSDLEIISSDDWRITRVYAHNVRGRAFGGRLDGDVEARFSTSQSLNVQARIQRGEVEQLSQWTGTDSVVGRGRFDATLQLASPRYRTTRDLQGRLDLEFEDTSARTLPVSDQLARFVPLFGLGATEFERGKLAATISQGTLRMRSLALWGRQLSVLGSGNVGLTNGRLDVQLVVRVGGGLSQQLAANYLTQLAASSVPPVELLLQINRLVANRAIFLRVAGTSSQPIIQPQTARFIEQALLRSLLEQVVGIPGAISVAERTTNP